MSKSLIVVPYAYDTDGTSVNIKNEKDSFTIYMKNCCCALLSAKHYNPNSDVAFVTNVQNIPKDYRELLERSNVLIFYIPFTRFLFPDCGTWRLAFYKLNALSLVIESHPEYEYYAYLDSDVVVQDCFDTIWNECNDNILMYDICQGLQVNDYVLFSNECKQFFTKFQPKNEVYHITRYGGEFFAAKHELAQMFITECTDIYNKMLESSFRTSKGDEFIISIAAYNLSKYIKNAGAYVYRFWTGSFRLISTSYKNQPVSVIHVPGEKENGMLKLYNQYWKKHKVPTKRACWRVLHIILPSPLTVLKMMVKAFCKSMKN